MRRLKKCVVVTCFAENQPGYLDFSYRIQALAEQYQLVILSQDVLNQSELMVPDAEYVAVGRFHGKLGWLKYLWLCARQIRQHKPAVTVLLHSSAAPISLLIGNIPSCLYWNEHPTNLIHLPNAWSLKTLLVQALHQLVFIGAKRADVVMPIGEEHRDELLHRGCNPARVHMIYMGVADQFAELPADKQQHDVLSLIYVGSISIPRGRDVMLQAMQQVAQHQVPVKLTMVGAVDQELLFCQEFIAQHQLEQYLEVRGRVPGSEIPQILAQAQAGICLWEDKPWLRFNPPTKLFEYLVAGLPVLASDIRTHTRYIENGSNGIIFAYHPKTLAEAIMTLYQSRSRLAEFSEHASESGKVHLWSQIKPVFLDAVNKVEQA